MVIKVDVKNIAKSKGDYMMLIEVAPLSAVMDINGRRQGKLTCERTRCASIAKPQESLG